MVPINNVGTIDMFGASYYLLLLNVIQFAAVLYQLVNIDSVWCYLLFVWITNQEKTGWALMRFILIDLDELNVFLFYIVAI